MQSYLLGSHDSYVPDRKKYVFDGKLRTMVPKKGKVRVSAERVTSYFQVYISWRAVEFNPAYSWHLQ